MTKPYFARGYFDNKPLDKLKTTITPNWDDQYIQKTVRWLNIPKTACNILEIGCGIGRLLRPIQRLAHVQHCYGVDASHSMVKEAKQYCGSNNTSVYWCPGNGEFDAPETDIDFVFAWLVFQHIADTQTVLRYCANMAQTLRVNGIIKCQLLANDEQPGKDLWTWHDPSTIQQVLESNGCVNVNTYHLPMRRWIIVEGTKT